MGALRASPSIRLPPRLVFGTVLAGCAAAAAAAVAGLSQDMLTWLVLGLLLALPVGYLLWQVEPAYVFTAAIVLSPMSGNWEGVGLPGALAPDRLLLVVAVGLVALRAPRVKDRPKLRIEPVHWALALAVIYAIASAMAVDELSDRSATFRLLESFGILPFLAFLVAPLAFRTERQRNILLAGLVALGAYLALTAIFEKVGPTSLVFPRFIADPEFGIHFGRARGPFVEASTNGFALYACGVAAAVAAGVWRRPAARRLAGFLVALCVVGAFLSLERSVWVAAAVSTLVVFVAFRELRRPLARAAMVSAAGVAVVLLLVPGLSGQADDRINSSATEWSRLNQTRAGLNMIEARPLLGFGWSEYAERHVEYMEQDPNFPLEQSARINLLHNVFLGYAVELGLVGLTLWAAAFALLVIGTATTSVTGDRRLWQAGFVAIVVAAVVVMSFTPPKAFTMLIIAMCAGVVWSQRYETPSVRRDRTG